MMMGPPILSLLLSSLALVSVVVHGAEIMTLNETSTALTWMLTMDQVNSIVMSESSADYGTPLTAQESADKWVESTAFRWNYIRVDRTAELGPGFAWFPFIVCSTAPGLSGAERFEAVYAMLTDVADAADSFLFEGDSFYNDDDMTCRLVSTETRVFADVMQSDDPSKVETLQYLMVQPSLTSIKMAEGSFDAIVQSMESYCGGDCAEDDAGGGGITTGGLATTGGGRRSLSGDRKLLASSSSSSSSSLTLSDHHALRHRSAAEEEPVPFAGPSLALVLGLSPIVLHFIRTGEATFDGIVEDIADFIKRGPAVSEASFYVQTVANDNNDRVVSDRMQFYADVVGNVTKSMVDEVTGTNACLDNVLSTDIRIENIKGNETIGVTVESIGGDLTEAEFDTCLFYMVHALTLHPYVATMDTKAIVVPLPTDSPPTPVPAPPAGGVDTSGAVSESLLWGGLTTVAAAGGLTAAAFLPWLL